MVMQHIPTDITVDHINLNQSDNCQANLCLLDRRAQAINQGVKSTNISGVIGVSYIKKSKSWVATWQDAKHNQWSKSYSTKKYNNANAMAWMIRELPHYREALQLDAEA